MPAPQANIHVAAGFRHFPRQEFPRREFPRHEFPRHEFPSIEFPALPATRDGVRRI